MPKRYQDSDYEIARSLIDLDYESASHDFKGIMKSMGWSKRPERIVKCAEQKLRADAWTKEDVDNLAEIIAGLRNKGIKEDNIRYDDNVEDYKTNLIAGYMIKALKACQRRRK